MLRVAVFGATGRMGAAVVRALNASAEAELSGALTVPGDANVGKDAGSLAGVGELDVPVSDDPQRVLQGADVAIDFTLPAAFAGNLAASLEADCPLVMGTTGLDESQQQALETAGERVAVVYGRNMSVGVNVFTELARQATRYLGPDWDVEISESHHRFKVDAPSGTALQIGEAVAAERGQKLQDVADIGRKGDTGPRAPGAIGFSSIRAGSLVGEHSLLLAGENELLELRHVATDRAAFADGALRAARWVSGRPAGLYSMGDVLGIAAS
ncbi:MAG: 4-hydroxy-tetrahydrodipicolinate reductase [Gammaproteobacteria bacterium]